MLIQCDEEIGDDKVNDIKSQVDQLLMQNRSLCSDFQEIMIFKKRCLKYFCSYQFGFFCPWRISFGGGLPQN